MKIKITPDDNPVSMIIIKRNSEIVSKFSVHDYSEMKLSNSSIGTILGIIIEYCCDNLTESLDILISNELYTNCVRGLLENMAELSWKKENKSVTICHPRIWLEQHLIYQTKRSKVYHVCIQNHDYSVKIMSEKLNEEKKGLMIMLSERSSSLSRVYYIGYIYHSDFNTVIVSDYIYGKHIHGILPNIPLENQLRCISQLERDLIITNTVSNLSLPTTYDRINTFIEISDNTYVKNLGYKIIDYWAMISSTISQNSMCLYDIHRDNMILDKCNKWHIIDIDSLIIGSATFTFSCYLAASLLLEGHPVEQIVSIIKRYHPSSYERIVLEIIIRLFWGLSFFSRKGEDSSLYNRYRESLKLVIGTMRSSYFNSNELNGFLINL